MEAITSDKLKRLRFALKAYLGVVGAEASVKLRSSKKEGQWAHVSLVRLPDRMIIGREAKTVCEQVLKVHGVTNYTIETDWS